MKTIIYLLGQFTLFLSSMMLQKTPITYIESFEPKIIVQKIQFVSFKKN
jgi:hypothetical protein